MYATLTDARATVAAAAEHQVIAPEQFEDVVATVARQVFDKQIEDTATIQQMIEQAADA